MDEFNNEPVLLTARPNVVLFAIEAVRLYLFVFFGYAVVIALVIFHKWNGVPWQFVATIVAELLLFAYIALLLLEIFIASRLIFVLTETKVLLLFRQLSGVFVAKLSIAVSDITSIETSSYNNSYGSVYIKTKHRNKFGNKQIITGMAQSSPITITDQVSSSMRIKRRDPLSIWLSVSLTSVPLVGFYGFKQFEEFADLILKARIGTGPN